ncbi:MAG: hypothetical protein R3185_08485, partial [Candidatus Thermoplasmatota archaeon]|nr:hypothetical protein [Candidatus Thermoplasmatota archaeon]
MQKTAVALVLMLLLALVPTGGALSSFVIYVDWEQGSVPVGLVGVGIGRLGPEDPDPPGGVG